MKVSLVSAPYFTLVMQLLVTALARSDVTGIICTSPCKLHTALALLLCLVLLIDHHDCCNDGPEDAKGGEETEQAA